MRSDRVAAVPTLHAVTPALWIHSIVHPFYLASQQKPPKPPPPTPPPASAKPALSPSPLPSSSPSETDAEGRETAAADALAGQDAAAAAPANQGPTAPPRVRRPAANAAESPQPAGEADRGLLPKVAQLLVSLSPQKKLPRPKNRNHQSHRQLLPNHRRPQHPVPHHGRLVALSR